MNESKELLEATVKGLQEKIQSLQTDLNEKQKELNDINKPVMEAWMYDEIHGLVEDGVGDYDFSDADNYEFDPEFDYDNRIVIGSIEMNDTSYIVESIMNKIDRYFKVLPTNTEENTITEVKKVI
jgi:hypothetical protein|tara:strand:+ start:235 stop:609 length:375 start_codon:yes stop_codon:yes gene_type:complete